MTRRWIAIGLLILGVGCDEKSTETAEPASVPTWEDVPDGPAEGPRFEDEDFELVAKPAHVCVGETPLAPPEGQRRISIPIVLDAKSERAVPVGPLLFSLEDEEGHRFRATLAGCAAPIRPKKLQKGERLQGEIAFDVPQGATGLELLFEPFLVGRKEVRARVEITLE